MFKNIKTGTILFLLIFHASQSVYAETATNLKCKGCVGTKDLANKAVSTSKLKNDSVNLDKLGPDVRVILDTVESNETRITVLEQGIPAVDLTGYGLPFSELGNPINVVVLKRDNGNGTFSYSVRTRYANDTDQISVQGSLITPPWIANSGSVDVDSGGTIISIKQYIEAPMTSNYLDYTVEDKNLDPANPANTLSLNSDNIREIWSCSGDGAVSTCSVESRIDDVYNTSFTPVNVYTPLGAGTINGMPFANLRGSNSSYVRFPQYRVRAKGIGTVIDIGLGRPLIAIYYRVNGATGGSLIGTPFEPGQPMDGIWF